MKFKELLNRKNITGYALSKATGIPYTTINDLINGRTIIQNVSLKNAILLSDCLEIDLITFSKLETIDFIDFYYKNNGKEYAYYLLALIDYLSRKYDIPKYSRRYNELRKEALDKPFFVGSSIIKFKSIEEAEEKLKIQVIPEFKKFNIIEEDIFNVA